MRAVDITSLLRVRLMRFLQIHNQNEDTRKGAAKKKLNSFQKKKELAQ
jgi:hypothetical protein